MSGQILLLKVELRSHDLQEMLAHLLPVSLSRGNLLGLC